MKTAISLEDNLLREADQTARRMGLSRSRLFSLALQDYLRNRRQEAMVERLNQVYGATPDLEEKDAARKIKAKFRRTVRERW
jgi:metal-responsive CopG/Arc/MetJ family transcriptional regulator